MKEFIHAAFEDPTLRYSVDDPREAIYPATTQRAIHREFFVWFDGEYPVSVHHNQRIERFFLDYYTEEQAAEYLQYTLRTYEHRLLDYALQEGLHVARISRKMLSYRDHIEIRLQGIAVPEKPIEHVRPESQQDRMGRPAPPPDPEVFERDGRILAQAWALNKEEQEEAAHGPH